MATPQNYLAVIKVVGIGGGGVNAVNRLADIGLKGVEFVAINTDAQQLLMSDADVKLDIGRNLTRGLGAGADPDVGRQAAEDHAQDIEEVLRGADMVFVTAGEGGGTGTGAAPVVARIARSLGALTVGVVTKPFKGEGRRRMERAVAGVEELRSEVDTLIVIPNDKLMSLEENHSISLDDAFKEADSVLLHGVAGITELITTPGLINLDFADVKSVMKDAGTALMGIGYASGPDRAIEATRMAMSNPLLEASINGARGVLFSISGGEVLLAEMNAAMEMVETIVDPDANIIMGAVIDNTQGDQVKVTLVAAGFAENPRRGAHVRTTPAASAAPEQVSNDTMPVHIPPVAAAPTVASREPIDIDLGEGHFDRVFGRTTPPAPSRPMTDDLDVPDFLR